MKTRELCIVAVMAALLCILAPLSVPIGPIPISLATFAIYLAGGLLGWKRALAATAVYILLGAVGVPVFAGFTGGAQKLLGVTGGYIVGYLPLAAIVGLSAERGKSRLSLPLGMMLGTAVLYAIGTAWFMIAMGRSLGAALGACVLPFLPGDALKIAAACGLCWALRRRLAPLLA